MFLWLRACSIADLKMLGHLLITTGGKKIIVIFLKNGGTAVSSATCPHQGKPLE
jgi:nitrite reductase/ring-hydroxylating ferredoxin subunit